MTNENNEQAIKIKRVRERCYKVLEIADKMATKIAKETGNWSVSNAIADMQVHFGYSEPGYDAPNETVVTGCWNVIDRWNSETNKHDLISDLPKRVGELLEKIGAEVEWGDEWSGCADRMKLVRTQGDSYSWQPSFWWDDNGCHCHECTLEDPSDYLDTLKGNAKRCNTLEDLDLLQYGYKKVDEDYECGWYGSIDDPKKIAEKKITQVIEAQGYTVVA